MIFNLPRERLQNEPFSFPPFLQATAATKSGERPRTLGRHPTTPFDFDISDLH